MKAKNVVVFTVLGLILFQGCIPSLHPLYTKDKLVMKEEVLGIWTDNEKQSDPSNPVSEWHFKANADQSYTLVFYDTEGIPATFDAHLIRLGESYFFNFQPYDPSKKDIAEHPGLDRQRFNEFEVLHFYPMNTFAKVTFKNEQLGISMFNGDFLEKLLKQNRIRIKHEKVDDGYVLTASSEELQKFVLKYADDEDAFPEADMLVKAL